MTAPKLTDAEALAVLDALHPVCPKPVRDHFAALTYARAAVEASKAEAVEGGRRYGHYGDQVRALPPESGGQGESEQSIKADAYDMVAEALRDAGLLNAGGSVVNTVRGIITQPSAAVTEAGEKASVLAAIKFLRPEYEAWSDTRKVAFDRITAVALSQGAAKQPSAAVTEAMVTDALCAFYCEPPTDPDGGDSFDASSRLRMRRTITAALSQGVAHPIVVVTEATIEAAWRAATPIEGETGGAAFRRGIEAAIRHHALSQGGKP